MINLQIKTLVTVLGIFSVGACGFTPRNGPDDMVIQEQATTRLDSKENTLGYDYVLVDVTKNVLPFISEDQGNSFTTLGSSQTQPPVIRLGVGDVVQVTIFESQAGGLFIPEEAGARPGNYVELPPQEIGDNGQITVPYAGAIRAAGSTPAAVEGTIQRRLADRAIEPEVSVAIVEQNFPRVSIIGDVAAPGSFILRNSGDRVLDLIAQAGGIRNESYETFVTLSRGNASAKIAYESLVNSPRENIYLAPGDSINLTTESKQFFVFGASGAVGEFDFEAGELDLNSAVAKARGLNDNQADPRQVFIYRTEHHDALKHMGVDLTNVDAPYGAVPTIYRANYRKPDSFFMSKQFKMRDGDIMYVSNANSVEIAKFFGIATTVTGGPVSVDSNVDALTGN